MRKLQEGPEDFGPLTQEQHDEFLDHALRGETLHETEQHSRSYENILRVTPESDPSHRRFKQLLDESNRYAHLLRRFKEWGVAETVELTQPH